MATIIERTIGTGGDYATVALWAAAIPADLVAADEVWRGLLLNQELTVAGSSGFMGISNKTCDATRYIELTTAPGASIFDRGDLDTLPLRYDGTKGAALKFTGSSGVGMSVTNIAYFRMSKIQMCGTDTGTTTAPSLFSSNGANADIDRCLFEGFSGVTAGVVSLAVSTSAIRNTVVIQKTTNTSGRIINASNGLNLVNCTLVSIGATLTTGVTTGAIAGTFVNTYIGGVVSPETGAINTTRTNCFCSTSSTGYSVAPLDATTFESVTLGTHDFRLKAGSLLLDAGTADARGATGIYGTSRPQGSAYDVGAWEAEVAAIPPVGDISWTEENDAVSIAGEVFLPASGSIAWTEADDIVAISGNVASPTSAAITWTEEDDVIAIEVAVDQSGLFVTEPLTNNTESIWANTAVVWSWLPAGRIGSLASVAATDGSGTTDADGILTVSGLPSGAGILMVAIQVTDATDDSVYYEAGTVT